MKTLRNYFLKEFFTNFLLSLIAITLVMVLGNIAKLSDMVIRKGIDISSALKLFLYFIPYLLKYSLPISCLMGILLAKGRLSSDNEIIAAKSLGISPVKLLLVYMTVGLTASLFLIIVNDQLVPYAHYNSMKIIKTAGKKNITSFIEAGKFTQFKDFVIFAQDVERNKLKKVFIYKAQENSSSNIIFAEEGEFTVAKNTLKVKLTNGFIQNPKMQYRIQYKNHFMNIPIENRKSYTKRKTCDMSISELRKEIALMKKKNILNAIPLEIELHDKISLSFSAFVFIILGFGVGLKIQHRSKGLNFGISFVAAMAYYLLNLAGKTMAFKGILSPALGLWMPNMIFLIIGGYYAYKACAY